MTNLRHHTARTFAALVAGLLTIALVAGCGGSDSPEDSSAGSSGDVGPAPAGAAEEIPESFKEGGRADGVTDYQAGSANLSEGPSSSSGGQSKLVDTRALIKTGAVGLRSDDVALVVQRVTTLVTGAGGEIADESTSSDRDGEATYSKLVVAVPVDDFDATIDSISELATRADKSRHSEDVTTAVADVDARVTSARDAITSLRRLYVRAKTLGQIITLESQLSQRQADLESLLAQQRSLAEQTTMSRITVTVAKPPKSADPTPEKSDEQAGFVTGLKQGWDALVTFVVGLGHVVGVVLPLLPVVLVLAGGAWVGVRRFSRLAAARSSEPAQPAV